MIAKKCREKLRERSQMEYEGERERGGGGVNRCQDTRKRRESERSKYI